MQSIAESEQISDNAWIFIDEHISRESKISLATDYEFIATMAHAPLISIILRCDFEKDTRKVIREQYRDYATYNAKLRELENKRRINAKEGIFRFRNQYEFELDVATHTPTSAAEAIRDHIAKVKRMLTIKEDRRIFGSWDHSRLN